MFIGYARVSKSDNSQVLDLQIDALKNAGVDENNIYTDKISGSKDERPGLDNCIKALRDGDTLVVWKQIDSWKKSKTSLLFIVDDLAKEILDLKC